MQKSDIMAIIKAYLLHFGQTTLPDPTQHTNRYFYLLGVLEGLTAPLDKSFRLTKEEMIILLNDIRFLSGEEPKDGNER